MSSIWAVSRLAVKGHFSPNQGSRKSVVYTIQSATENILQTLKWGLLATKEWCPSLQSIQQRFSLGIEMQAVYTYTLQLQVSHLFWALELLMILDVAMLSYGMPRACSFMLQYPAFWQRYLWTYTVYGWIPIQRTIAYRYRITIMLTFCPNIQAVQQSTRSRHFFQNMLHL